MNAKKDSNPLYDFVKPNGTPVKVNENSAPYAIQLGWLPVKEYEAKVVAAEAAAPKAAAPKAPVKTDKAAKAK